MSFVNYKVLHKYNMAALLGNAVEYSTPDEASFVHPAAQLLLLHKSLHLSWVLSGFPFQASSDGEFLLKHAYQLITFCQVFLAMHMNTDTTYTMLKNMLRNIRKFMYRFHLPSVLWPRLSPPCTSSPHFPGEAADLIPQHPVAPSKYRTQEQDAKVMRQTEGTHQGDNLGVGKGVFCLFCFLQDGETPTLDSGREKSSSWSLFNTDRTG